MNFKTSSSRRGQFLSLFIAFLLLTANAVSAFSQVQVQQRLIHPLPPTRYIRSHDFDTRHVALNLHFDWEKEQVIGTATMSFSPLVKDLKTIELDAANMTFAGVSLAPGAALKFEAIAENQKLRIILDRAYQPAEMISIVIDYRTNGPVPKLVGLVGGGIRFIKPTADDPKRPRQIWTQGESEYNHYWFPCYDHPNDFFTTEITATVEKPLIVISNGKLLETKETANGERAFHWKIDQPHASYLTSVIVGEFVPVSQEYEGIPVVTNVYPSEIAEGKVTAARLAEMVKFFSEKTGLKYPYAKYAQTTVRDFGGGMENISATTQTDNMIHDARTELDQNSDGLQSHELAHQWFGDYVTCRSWSDIWLNESFATYFQAMWDEHHLGRDDFLYSDVKSNQDQYFNAWKAGNRRPIVTKNYATPDSVFDTYAYPRGAAVLHMLRTWLGEDNWWRAINHYLTKYANQPVDTEQFRIAIEEATGQSMDWFFDEWLYQMGHPVFQITRSYDAQAKKLKLVVKQTQKPDLDWQYPQVSFFQTPVDVELVVNGTARIERVNIEPREEQAFTFAADADPQLVNFDYGNTIIKEVDFQKSTKELVFQVSRDEDVAGRIWALGQLTKRMGAQGPTTSERELITAQVAETLKSDKFWGMRLEAATALTSSDAVARQALIAAVKDPDARVRARAITSLAISNDQSLAPIFAESLKDRSYGVIRAAALALGQTKSAEAYPNLAKLLGEPSWRDSIRISALNGLTALGDARALEAGLTYSEKGNSPAVRGAALKLVGAAGKADARSFAKLSKDLNEASGKGDFTVASGAAEGLANLGDPRGLDLFQEILKKPEISGQLKASITKVEERLRQTASTPGTPPKHP